MVRRRAGATGGAARPVRAGGRGRHVLQRHREPEPPLLHDAGHPGPGPGLRRRRGHQRGEGRAGDRGEVRRAAAAVRGAGGARRGAAAARLRDAPAAAVPAAGPDVRAALRPGGRRRAAARRLLRGGRRREGASRAGVAGGRHQGARHLARHPDDPGVPRGVRRGRVPRRQPVRRAQGGHRRVHDVRGRQPRAAPARGEGAADRLRGRVRGDGPARHGPVRDRDGRGDGGRADQRAQAARADQGRAAGRRPLGRRGGHPRLELPPGDAAVPRGARAGGRRAPPQARHRRRDEPRPRVLAGAGPRDRRRPRARRAAGAGGVRRQARRRWRTARTSARCPCCATCTRCR